MQSFFYCFFGSLCTSICSILLLSLQSFFYCFFGSLCTSTCSILPSCLGKVSSIVSLALFALVHALSCSCLCKVFSWDFKALVFRLQYCSFRCKDSPSVSKARFEAFLILSCLHLTSTSSAVSISLLCLIDIRLLFLPVTGTFLFNPKGRPQTHTDFCTFTIAKHCVQTFVRGILNKRKQIEDW